MIYFATRLITSIRILYSFFLIFFCLSNFRHFLVAKQKSLQKNKAKKKDTFFSKQNKQKKQTQT